MLSKTYSFGLFGIDAYPVEIEVDVANGLPSVTIVGLADTAIRESRERVKSAIKNSGFSWPEGRITINLAPSWIKKEGAAFDLAIALGILGATQQLNTQRLKEFHILGEVSLDGCLRPIRGALPISMAISLSDKKNMLIPFQNAREAAIVEKAAVWPIKTLKEAVEFLTNPETISPYKEDLTCLFQRQHNYSIDFSEVKGQYLAKRAIEIAVSGGHNILMLGPPGSGKTMLAKRIPTIMPELTLEESLEITTLHSIIGALPVKDGIITARPFRNPHHTISDVALVGGGSIPQPGEISLAQHGVLFLDELPEFNRKCLEALRQPLEEGKIRISRINKSLLFPASFLLACAMNPCPCGNLGAPNKICRCNPQKIENYLGKISRPLLDRIDIHIELPSLKYTELSEEKESENSQAIKNKVRKTREVQRIRFRNTGIYYNAQMNGKLIRKYCVLEDKAKELLKLALADLGLSARGYDKVLKISRTIADLANSEIILAEHISEAVQYRILEKQ